MDALAALPPPAPGKTRVFRGQDTDYEHITPASYRTRLASRSVWAMFSRALLNHVNPQFAARHLALDELAIQSLWLEAVAQHYGSGSSYLDVTHSIESAAWFALHTGRRVLESAVAGAGGGSGPGEEWTQDVGWVQYSRATEPGYLYAFDVDVWDGQGGLPAELALVDLSHAPPPFCTPRMSAQLGCVISVGKSDDYDLRRHGVAGTPLRIAWPMADSEMVQWPVERMFPGPAADPWLRMVLNAPLVATVNTNGRLTLSRPLPVTLYSGQSAAYNAEVKATEWFLNPPLLHPLLCKDVMSGATAVVFEAPLLGLFPTAASGLWNHELLLSDVAESAGSTPLTNVLFQFSPLEEVFGESGRNSAERHRLIRGLWLSGREGAYRVALVVQDFPERSLQVTPMVHIRWDAAARRMVYQPLNADAQWTQIGNAEEWAKPLFVVLYLLRTLHPRMKAEATPLRYILTEEDGQPMHQYHVSLFADPARLVRIQAPQEVGDWFVLRNQNGDPFTTATASSPSAVVKTAAAFADIPAQSFADAIAKASHPLSSVV